MGVKRIFWEKGAYFRLEVIRIYSGIQAETKRHTSLLERKSYKAEHIEEGEDFRIKYTERGPLWVSLAREPEISMDILS